MTADPNRLAQCLAYVVVSDYNGWLGAPTLRGLEAFLSGAEDRVAFTGSTLPAWRINGPLDDPAFYRPLVARTGHPSLTIRWVTALELHHYSLEKAMKELRSLLEAWGDSFTIPDEANAYHRPASTLEQHLRHLARRPGMYLGKNSGWLLRCYLTGLDRGGDWLGLPVMAALRPIVDGIEDRSQEHYGSRFGAFRVYEDNPAELLSWVGITAE